MAANADESGYQLALLRMGRDVRRVQRAIALELAPVLHRTARDLARALKAA